jgi:hypothetical protein
MRPRTLVLSTLVAAAVLPPTARTASADVPSQTCQTEPGAIQVVDATVPYADERVYVYSGEPTPGRRDLCVGASGFILAAGMRIYQQ